MVRRIHSPTENAVESQLSRFTRDAGATDERPSNEPTEQTAEPINPTDRLPVEFGLMLMTAGMITGMLPPPPGPFDLSLIVAGGLALWPRGFQGVERWLEQRLPRAHRSGAMFLHRFLHDLEKRYPGSTGE
jgi:hypothetical protein